MLPLGPQPPAPAAASEEELVELDGADAWYKVEAPQR